MADPKEPAALEAPPPPPPSPSPPPLPRLGRPLPPLPEGPPFPEIGPSPADLALAADGGEIIPIELTKGPPPLDFKALKPVAAAPPAAEPGERKPIDVQGMAGGAKPDGTATGARAQPPVPGVQPPPPLSPEEQAHIQLLDSTVNYEVNVYRLCYHAVHEMVLMRVREEPMDTADIGQGIWGAGKRTPLEQAEPQVAIEVYQQVRTSMREGERAGKRADVQALIGKVLGGLFGG